MNLTTRMIRGTERAERENEPANAHVILLERELLSALQSCPAHYTAAQSARKLRVSLHTLRLMKELSQSLA